MWDVVVLPNDDIATISQDGVLRLWTRDPTRIASEEIRSQFMQEVSETESAIAQKQQQQGSEYAIWGPCLTPLAWSETLIFPNYQGLRR